MRTVFIGASSLSITTARLLLRNGHEVVLIEQDKAIIDELSGDLECGFVLGDGSKPAVLREVDPGHTDFLFCLTDADQANILASLVGRSLGFKRVVTKIDNAELEHVCLELGLRDTIIPGRAIGRYLAEMVDGQDSLELSGMIKGDARLFSFVAREPDEGAASELDLPSDSRLICLYRDGKFLIADPDTTLRKGDEVVVLAQRRALEALDERFPAERPGRIPPGRNRP
jgi:trk system potassium uptake protein TrkA